MERRRRRGNRVERIMNQNHGTPPSKYLSLFAVSVPSEGPITSHVEPGQSLRINRATLRPNPRVGKRGRSILYFKVQDLAPVALCSLRLEVEETCPLDIDIPGPCDVVFTVVGPRAIDIVGHYFGDPLPAPNPIDPIDAPVGGGGVIPATGEVVLEPPNAQDGGTLAVREEAVSEPPNALDGGTLHLREEAVFEPPNAQDGGKLAVREEAVSEPLNALDGGTLHLREEAVFEPPNAQDGGKLAVREEAVSEPLNAQDGGTLAVREEAVSEPPNTLDGGTLAVREEAVSEPLNAQKKGTLVGQVGHLDNLLQENTRQSDAPIGGALAVRVGEAVSEPPNAQVVGVVVGEIRHPDNLVEGNGSQIGETVQPGSVRKKLEFELPDGKNLKSNKEKESFSERVMPDNQSEGNQGKEEGVQLLIVNQDGTQHANHRANCVDANESPSIIDERVELLNVNEDGTQHAYHGANCVDGNESPSSIIEEVLHDLGLIGELSNEMHLDGRDLHMVSMGETSLQPMIREDTGAECGEKPERSADSAEKDVSVGEVEHHKPSEENNSQRGDSMEAKRLKTCMDEQSLKAKSKKERTNEEPMSTISEDDKEDNQQGEDVPPILPEECANGGESEASYLKTCVNEQNLKAKSKKNRTTQKSKFADCLKSTNPIPATSDVNERVGLQHSSESEKEPNGLSKNVLREEITDGGDSMEAKSLKTCGDEQSLKSRNKKKRADKEPMSGDLLIEANRQGEEVLLEGGANGGESVAAKHLENCEDEQNLKAKSKKKRNRKKSVSADYLKSSDQIPVTSDANERVGHVCVSEESVEVNHVENCEGEQTLKAKSKKKRTRQKSVSADYLKSSDQIPVTSDANERVGHVRVSEDDNEANEESEDVLLENAVDGGDSLEANCLKTCVNGQNFEAKSKKKKPKEDSRTTNHLKSTNQTSVSYDVNESEGVLHISEDNKEANQQVEVVLLNETTESLKEESHPMKRRSSKRKSKVHATDEAINQSKDVGGGRTELEELKPTKRKRAVEEECHATLYDNDMKRSMGSSSDGHEYGEVKKKKKKVQGSGVVEDMNVRSMGPSEVHESGEIKKKKKKGEGSGVDSKDKNIRSTGPSDLRKSEEIKKKKKKVEGSGVDTKDKNIRSTGPSDVHESEEIKKKKKKVEGSGVDSKEKTVRSTSPSHVLESKEIKKKKNKLEGSGVDFKEKNIRSTGPSHMHESEEIKKKKKKVEGGVDSKDKNGRAMDPSDALESGEIKKKKKKKVEGSGVDTKDKSVSDHVGIPISEHQVGLSSAHGVASMGRDLVLALANVGSAKVDP